MLSSRHNKNIFLLFLIFFLIVVSLISLSYGQINIPLKNTLATVLYHLGMWDGDNAFTKEQDAVIWFIRMPRVLIGIMVGAGLGISGAVMQGLFNNPLVDPGITGVSAGAAAGAVLAIALGWSAENILVMPMFALGGSISAVFLTVFLAMRRGKIPVMTLLLAGVVVGMLLGAVTAGILTVMNEQKLQSYLFWIIGGLDYRRWEHVYIAVPPILTGILIMLAAARHLNVLAMGETEARAVGMAVLPFRMGIMLTAAAVTAVSVCVSGNIGFVGLIIPHMMRILLGPDHRLLLPASALAGAVFLVGCDLLGRVIIPPAEIRVGIMTALIGAPYFLYLLRRMQRNF
ncbi:FecCD family ABC transporter permease [Pectinatus cerevisiiphilus]|uniref:Iron complex transport system permease protein n=1 Tax=Pectinatus cerevisiiphilus TaxID=86956 RepID=A0A4R3KE72_9FIRM|nr:iron ABC transporter permease [Pectinatus cerevisiiphilus]TCS81400.1 iron complex transport system permease protein [Pectinatus cerevisiiphilus]